MILKHLCVAPLGNPRCFLYDASKPLKESNLNYAIERRREEYGEGERERELSPLYVFSRHLAVHLNFGKLVLTLYLDSTGVD